LVARGKGYVDRGQPVPKGLMDQMSDAELRILSNYRPPAKGVLVDNEPEK
jgi:hypothetical protein